MKGDTFVEIGSGSTLLRLVRKCIDDDDDDVLYVPSVDESGHIDRALIELKKSEQVERRSSTVKNYVWRDLDEVEIVKDNVEKTPLLTQFVLESIARVLPGNRSISLDDSLVRSGLDSLSAIELCSRIASKFPNVELSSSQILRTNSVRDLIRTISSHSKTPTPSTTPPPSTTPTPTPTPSSTSFPMSSLQQGMVFQRRMSSDRRKCSWRAWYGPPTTRSMRSVFPRHGVVLCVAFHHFVRNSMKYADAKSDVCDHNDRDCKERGDDVEKFVQHDREKVFHSHTHL